MKVFLIGGPRNTIPQDSFRIECHERYSPAATVGINFLFTPNSVFYRPRTETLCSGNLGFRTNRRGFLSKSVAKSLLRQWHVTCAIAQKLNKEVG
jgi:hypothetical protein